MRKNLVKAKWEAGKAVIGCQNRTGSPMVSELFGLCGFDYVFIENEHFVFDPKEILNVVLGCDAGGTTPILRIVDSDPGKILQYLDLGVGGLLFPHVDTAEEAKAIVDAGKYPPMGNRGFSNTSRATCYGFLDMESYKKEANRETLLIPFIESRKSVENLDSILSSGVDAVHIGPGDLSLSYGTTAGDPKMVQLIKEILKECNKANVPCGLPAASIDEARMWISCGCKMIDFSSDMALLKKAGCEIVKAIGE